jgi:hypothetical protein
MRRIDRLCMQDDIVSFKGDIHRSLLGNTNIDLNLSCESVALLLVKARMAQRERHGLRELFPAAICRDPSWDILLGCFIAQLEQHPLCVKQIRCELDESNTALLRRLDDLQELGLVSRRRDDVDGRRTIVEISPKGMNAMAQFLDRYLALR